MMMRKHYTETELEKFFSWSRYLYWADRQRQQFVSYDDANEIPDDEDPEWHLVAVSAQWFASMWVVIEGWQELGYKDETIDSLLADYPDYCNLLRRFRNTVYHYQPKMIDKRMLEFSTEGGEHLMMWVFAIYLEFQRFMWEWPERFKGTKDQQSEIRQLLHQIIGWMPTNIITAMKQSIADQRETAIRMMRSAGDTTSPAALKLLAALDHSATIANGTPDTPILDYLKKFKPSRMTSDTGEPKC